MSDGFKKCPFCGCEISKKAVGCKNCGGIFLNDLGKIHCPFCLLEIPNDIYTCPYCDELLPRAFEYTGEAQGCCPHIPDNFDDIIGHYSRNLFSHSIEYITGSITKLKIGESIFPCGYIHELKCVGITKSGVLLESIENNTIFFVRSDIDIFFIKGKKYIIPDAIQPLKINEIINTYDSLCENSDYEDHLDNIEFVKGLYSNDEFFVAGGTKELLKKLSSHPEALDDGETCHDCGIGDLKIINYEHGFFEICTKCGKCRHIRFPEPIYE